MGALTPQELQDPLVPQRGQGNGAGNPNRVPAPLEAVAEGIGKA